VLLIRELEREEYRRRDRSRSDEVRRSREGDRRDYDRDRDHDRDRDRVRSSRDVDRERRDRSRDRSREKDRSDKRRERDERHHSKRLIFSYISEFISVIFQFQFNLMQISLVTISCYFACLTLLGDNQMLQNVLFLLVLKPFLACCLA